MGTNFKLQRMRMSFAGSKLQRCAVPMATGVNHSSSLLRLPQVALRLDLDARHSLIHEARCFGVGGLVRRRKTVVMLEARPHSCAKNMYLSRERQSSHTTAMQDYFLLLAIRCSVSAALLQNPVFHNWQVDFPRCSAKCFVLLLYLALDRTDAQPYLYWHIVFVVMRVHVHHSSQVSA